MRLFLGLPVSEKSVDEITRGIRHLKSSESGLRWVRPENYHFTLKFLGEKDEKAYQELVEVLAEIKFNKFQILISGLDLFPPNHPRILSAGVKKGKAELCALVADIEHCLAPVPAAAGSEDKFLAHLTVGRIKPDRDMSLLKSALEKINIEIPEEIGLFILYESILSAAGPEYIEKKIFKCQ